MRSLTAQHVLCCAAQRGTARHSTAWHTSTVGAKPPTPPPCMGNAWEPLLFHQPTVVPSGYAAAALNASKASSGLLAGSKPGRGEHTDACGARAGEQAKQAAVTSLQSRGRGALSVPRPPLRPSPAVPNRPGRLIPLRGMQRDAEGSTPLMTDHGPQRACTHVNAVTQPLWHDGPPTGRGETHHRRSLAHGRGRRRCVPGCPDRQAHSSRPIQLWMNGCT